MPFAPIYILERAFDHRADMAVTAANPTVEASQSLRARAGQIARRSGALWLAFLSIPWPASEWPHVGGWVRFAVSHFGHAVLGTPLPLLLPINGSGDRLYDWVSLVATAVLACAAALVWSIFDRKSRPALHRALCAYLRYTSAATLLGYGLAKLLPLQFPPPPATVLHRTFGESSPMRLLWTFMGASPAYTAVAGGVECAAAILLLFRRTAALGALVSCLVLGNVLLLDLCYDVPAKLFAARLLVASLVVAWPLLRTIVTFGAEPLSRRPSSREIAIRAVGSLVAAFIVETTVARYVAYARARPHFSLDSERFEVTSCEPDGPRCWTAVELAGRSLFVARRDGGSFRYSVQEQGTGSIRLRYASEGDDRGEVTLSWTRQEHGIAVSGDIPDGPLRLQLVKVPPRPPALFARGFHWVSERPYIQ